MNKAWLSSQVIHVWSTGQMYPQIVITDNSNSCERSKTKSERAGRRAGNCGQAQGDFTIDGTRLRQSQGNGAGGLSGSSTKDSKDEYGWSVGCIRGQIKMGMRWKEVQESR